MENNEIRFNHPGTENQHGLLVVGRPIQLGALLRFESAFSKSFDMNWGAA